ncbi:Ferri-bacillibactin esterase BesA [Aquimixticola soesokkakensis]|uniref:Ferri-bacillibactin esterase BesA n=1 Tax=Aquimixticola soesokkakensis TaxID=1519096 RepID=A0A1Y5T6B6_9RHOB|nr:alpha/beta hydrolase-fold protein [Aquimixticola soesokkakensis]SLN56776.1 Ferri-bacillibactin esterase BesA [Aquimixticola soesokkakensis]
MPDRPSPASLRAALNFAPVVPATPLDLPPHKGREAALRLFDTGSATHRLECIDASAITHPLAAPTASAYRIFRATPKGRAPARGWPVLYLLDGTAGFDFLTADLLAQVPGLIVIGIGHAGRAQFDRDARARDLTAPAHAPADAAPERQSGLVADAGYGDRLTGGAPQFASLLTGALRALAEADVPVDGARRTLWGHSLGGLFVLNLMFQAPQSFARYCAISPSLWWHPERLEAVMQRSLATQAPPVALYLASGNREQRTGSGGEIPTTPPEAFSALVARLSPLARFDLSHQIYDGAPHIATLPNSLAPTLGFAAF